MDEDQNASADAESKELWNAFQHQAHAITLMLDEPRDHLGWTRVFAWRRRRRRLRRDQGDRHGGEAQGSPRTRIGSPRDPELREALARLLASLEQAKRLIYVSDGGHARRRNVLKGLVSDAKDLDLDRLGRDAAYEFADAFDRALIDIGDDVYLLQELHREWFFHHRDASAEIWTGVFENRTPELLRRTRDCSRRGDQGPAAGAAMTEDQAIDQARDWLRALRWTRTARDRQRRTRRRLKGSVLGLSAVLVSVFVVVTSLVADELGSEWEALALSVCAGALGAGVSGTYRLRDEVQAGRAVREYAVTLSAQLAVGAAAGLVVALIIEAGLLRFGEGAEWTMQGVAAFVAGFSEAYFLGIVGRVSGSRTRPGRRESS